MQPQKQAAQTLQHAPARAPVCQRRDHEARAVAQVLVAIGDAGLGVLGMTKQSNMPPHEHMPRSCTGRSLHMALHAQPAEPAAGARRPRARTCTMLTARSPSRQ